MYIRVRIEKKILFFLPEISGSSFICWLKWGGDYSNFSKGSYNWDWAAAHMWSVQPSTSSSLSKDASLFLSGFDLEFHITPLGPSILDIWICGRWGRWNDDFFLLISPAFTLFYLSKFRVKRIVMLSKLLSYLIVFQTPSHSIYIHHCQ